VTCDGDASTCDSNQVIREQSFLPAGPMVCLPVLSADPVLKS
jgi:hypothetical protein